MDIQEINIRIENISPFDYTGVFVNTIGGEHQYGDILSGQKSSYYTFDKGYRYAFVELQIDGEVYTMQPIDYVGETPLDNGFYTYKIDAEDEGDRYGRLSLTFSIDN